MDGEQEANNKLIIKMMGEFSIQRGDRILDEKQGRAKKVLALIEYLIASRSTKVSQERLLEAIWDNEEFDNPLNTLKNLVYRARTLLKMLNPPGYLKYDFILHEGNSYTWNNELPCVVDTEQMEMLYKKSEMEEAGSEEQLQCYYQIQKLYTGEFLPKALYYEWALNRNAYFETLYTNSSKHLMTLLKQRSRFDELTAVCEQYNIYYPFDESVHLLLLEAYAQNNQIKKMMEHYQNITKMFFHEFGVSLSKDVVKTYKELMKIVHSIELDINRIEEELQENNSQGGAFICDYDTFKYIYQMEARSIVKNGISVYLALFTLTDKNGDLLPMALIKRGMPVLRKVLMDQLRRGDVMSNYSSVQWIALLMYNSYENGWNILEQIKRKFSEDLTAHYVVLQTSLNVIKPIE